MTYKQANVSNIPKADSEFYTRFTANDDISIIKENKWAKTNKIAPWNKQDTPDNFPAFNFNEMTLTEFYNHVTSTDDNQRMYRGMLERIGRTIIWADDLADNPFLRFMMTPLDYGCAVENGFYEDIYSRNWVKNFQSSGTHQQNPLFNTQIPKYVSDVATVNFSREIPMKMSEIEFKKACQTASMIGDVAGALMSKINVTFIDDMYEACKQYFCGVLRIKPEAEGNFPFTEDEFTNNSMIEVIDLKDVTCIEDSILDSLHKITDSQFYYKSRLYNLANKYTLSKKMTLIMSRKWRYPTFLKKFASTYHPEYIKLGEEVEPLYINEFPTMISNIYPTYKFPVPAPTEQDPKHTEDKNFPYELFGILVDNRCLAITPLNGGFNVGTFVNPSEGSTSYFGHYEFIFSFLPFFNRKYIFLKGHKQDLSKMIP